ncbi:MAG: hypothetical protein QXO04_01150 [Nitrososphaerota archaeon]
MILVKMIRARKYRMLVRGFAGQPSFHPNALIGGILGCLPNVGVPDDLGEEAPYDEADRMG